jgi:hypothetical protein
MPKNFFRDNKSGSLEQEVDSRDGENIASCNEIRGHSTQRISSKDRLKLPGGIVGIGTGAIVAAVIVVLAGYFLKYLLK